MKKLRIDELPVEMIRGNRVFVLINGTEPEASLPTLSWLLDQSARIILGFHSTDREAENMDLRLSAHLGRPVRRIPNVIGPDTSCAISQMTDHERLSGPKMPKPKTVLMPIDGSAHSKEAARLLAERLREDLVEITLLYVKKGSPSEVQST
jgi:hypothetical protein